MSVWLCIPSARPVEEVNARMDKWRAMGYKIALVRDRSMRDEEWPKVDFGLSADKQWGGYRGYAVAVNTLAMCVIEIDHDCDWIVCAGDDTDPDPTKRADEIALECSMYFAGFYDGRRLPVSAAPNHCTFGVMQPTGDPWRDIRGRIIERIAGSPWLGREWCRRAYGGNGPLFSGYTHCFADEELQCVAQRLGVFWRRPDLIHHHDHWARPRGNAADKPAFLEEATSAEHWAKYSALFAERKAAGFPGSEPIA